MLTLGIHDGINSSVLVCEDGRIRFALQEERCNGIKEFSGFPELALAHVMEKEGVRPQDVDAICLTTLKSFNTSRDQFLARYEGRAEQGMAHEAPSFKTRIKAALRPFVPESILEKRRQNSGVPTFVQPEERLAMAGFQNIPIIRKHHHFNHAAAAYFAARKDPESPHLVFTLDGAGEGICGQVYRAENGRLELLAETPMGNSIGNIWACTTHFMGMRPHEHEYKLMGLAAYVPSKYSEPTKKIFESYLGIDPANPLCFKRRIPEGTGFIGPRLAKDLKRLRFDNLSAGLQVFTEELLVTWVKNAVKATGIRNAVAAGGVFMNVKANMYIAQRCGLEHFDVCPSCGDETLSFGAVWDHASEHLPHQGRDIRLDTLCLGPDGTMGLQEAKAAHKDKLTFTDLDNPNEAVATLLAEGNIVARCSGRMEFGARALGNRSIIADASRPNLVPRINKMIKMRDFWMPFAPAVLRESADDYLHVPDCLPKERISPFMMHTFETTEKRNEISAGTHPFDNTARAEIVNSETYPDFHEVISRFKGKTGQGGVLNTSFNLHGWPIVMGAADAIKVFVNSDLTHLVVGDCLITK